MRITLQLEIKNQDAGNTGFIIWIYTGSMGISYLLDRTKKFKWTALDSPINTFNMQTRGKCVF